MQVCFGTNDANYVNVQGQKRSTISKFIQDFPVLNQLWNLTLDVHK